LYPVAALFSVLPYDNMLGALNPHSSSSRTAKTREIPDEVCQTRFVQILALQKRASRV
jgi:hypothetical protein